MPICTKKIHRILIRAPSQVIFLDNNVRWGSISGLHSFYVIDKQLVAICLDFFIAGALTTSYTLDFAVLATVTHPQVQKKLHEEIDKVLKRGQIPTIEDKNKYVYISSKFRN